MSTQLDPKLIEDLEVITKLIPVLDRTITIYGASKLKELVHELKYDITSLDSHRQVLENLIFTPKNKLVIINQLKKIKKLQDIITWFFVEDKQHQDLCFSYETLNHKDLLALRNRLKTYTPVILILVYVMIYLVLRYCGVSLGLGEYFSHMYESYRSLIMLVLGLIIGIGGLTSFLGNMLTNLYVLYQVYALYSTAESSITHYNKCNNLIAKLDQINDFLNCTKKIIKFDRFLEKSQVISTLQELQDIFNTSKINNIGYAIILKRNSLALEQSFNIILQYTGQIDAIISISKLVTELGYVFPKFDHTNPTPYLDIENMGLNNQITNSLSLGSPNTMIITGPNTSGKTTYIRNAMICVLLAQTLGVCPCLEITLTPMRYLFTYLDIPNISRERESLFEAEALRCLRYSKILESLPKNMFTFAILDELFTGTNPKEGLAGSYGFCDYLGSFENSLNIITTHFTSLTELAQEQPSKFINYKFELGRDANNNFTRNYKIAPGVSNQNIAIELLHRHGYSSKVINKALDYLDKLDKLENKNITNPENLK